MVALDLACQTLQSGQSDMGLVGGFDLIYSPVQSKLKPRLALIFTGHVFA